jgi:hypothetical protein
MMMNHDFEKLKKRVDELNSKAFWTWIAVVLMALKLSGSLIIG